MRNATTSETSLLGLIGHFRDEIKILIQEEVALAKTEMSEKMSRFGRNAVSLAIGGVAAFAALIILLASLSSLLSYAFENAGLQRSLAFFIGALIVGGVCGLVGVGFITKARKGFSKESLAPEKTLHTLKTIKPNGGIERPADSIPQPERSSNEIEASIGTTKQEVAATADEISERLTPRYMACVVKKKVQEHPVRSSLIGAGTVSGLLIWRRVRHARGR